MRGAILLVAVGLLLFSSTGRDDGHITYWVAYALATSGEMVNYNGAAVEQSSTFSLVGVLAILHAITRIPLPLLGVLVSVLSGAAAAWLTQRVVQRSGGQQALGAGLLVGTSSWLAYWSFSGMEASLAALAWIWLFGALLEVARVGLGKKTGAILAGAAALFVGARPEAGLVGIAWLAVFAALTWWNGRGADRESFAARPVLYALVSVAVAFALLTLFRMVYFGAPFPQPVRAKLGAGALGSGVSAGFEYLGRTLFGALEVLPTICAGAGGGLILILALRRRLLTGLGLGAASFVIVQLGFVAAAGGDWMEAGRFLVPAVPALAIVTWCLLERLPVGRPRAALLASLVLLQIVGSIRIAREDATGGPLWATFSAGSEDPQPPDASWPERANRIHRRNAPLIRRLEEIIVELDFEPDRKLILASGQMGMMCFSLARSHPGKLRILDRYGLVSPEYLDCSVSDPLARTQLGLELHYGFLLQNLAAYKQCCDIPRPDVIVDIMSNRNAIERRLAVVGYRLIHWQEGPVENGSSLLPGRPVHAHQFIAVRAKLLGRLGAAGRVTVLRFGANAGAGAEPPK